MKHNEFAEPMRPAAERSSDVSLSPRWPTVGRSRSLVRAVALALGCWLVVAASVGYGGAPASVTTAATIFAASDAELAELLQRYPDNSESEDAQFIRALIELRRGEVDAAQRRLDKMFLNASSEVGAHLPSLRSGEINALGSDRRVFHARVAYWLGAIAESNREFDRARTLYSIAARQFDDLGLQGRADAALMELTLSRAMDTPALTNDGVASAVASLGNATAILPASLTKSGVRRASARDTALGLLRVAGSFVDGLSTPDDLSVTPEAATSSDVSFETLAAGSTPIWRGERTRLRWSGTLFREDFVSFSDYSLQVVGTSIELARSFDGGDVAKRGHDGRLRVGATYIWLGNARYLRQLDMEVGSDVKIGSNWKLDLGVRAARADALESSFSHLDGVAFAGHIRANLPSNWRIGYRLGFDQRADAETLFQNESGMALQGFESYSRNFHSLSIEKTHHWGPRITQRLGASLRYARYHDPNAFLANTDDAALTLARRNGVRADLSSQLELQMTRRLSLALEVEYISENASLERYDFRSFRVGLGLEFLAF